MKTTLVAILTLVSATAVLAKDKPSYDKGVLLQMDSSSCGYAEKGSKTVVGEILGTDGEHKKTQQVLCQEYVLKADRLVYHIRPNDDKHPTLLPVGETAEFRIHKGKMLLRVPEADGKEREYTVVSVAQRTDVPDRAAPATAAAVNQ